MDDLQSYVTTLGRSARRAAQQLATLNGATKGRALHHMATALRSSSASLIAANAKDILAANEAQLAPALVKRLMLDEKKVEAMAKGIEEIAAQVDPVGQVIEGYVRPNGLRITKTRVPLGPSACPCPRPRSTTGIRNGLRAACR